MKMLILKGGPATSHPPLDTYLKNLGQQMALNSQPVETFNLAEMNIHYCTGCWSCWLKTPGRCMFRDDMEQILNRMLTADLVIFAAPLTMGFVHSSLKKIMDRLIPLVLPYINIYHGECHHYLRYSKTPDIAVLVAKEADTDNTDLEIATATFRRLALNFHNRLIFSETTETPLEVILDEISHI